MGLHIKYFDPYFYIPRCHTTLAAHKCNSLGGPQTDRIKRYRKNTETSVFDFNKEII